MKFCILLQVRSNLGGPRPFGNNPPLGSPRSPHAGNIQNTWSQPIYAPAPAPVSNNYTNYGSNTLPRSNAPGALLFLKKKIH